MQCFLKHMIAVATALLIVAAPTPSIAQKSAANTGALLCRHSNYLARDGKIYAADPENPTIETEITIKGVSWSGMETDNKIPDGLWGMDSVNSKDVMGTKISTLIQFLSNNSFNSIRLPLNADFINSNPFPQLSYIHGYENRELTQWIDPNNVKYLDLIGRVVQTFQIPRMTILLDIHLISTYNEDAFWYTTPYIEDPTEWPTYVAVSTLAQRFCNATYWNIIGIDLKNEMMDVQWNANDDDSDIKSNWKNAAEILANRVLELCPKWLVFVGGASSPTDAQRFTVDDKYPTLSNHWPGGNLKNATLNALKMNIENKIVFSPSAHTHGRFPQNYFYSTDSNCSTNSVVDFELEDVSECSDWINNAKVKSHMPCVSSTFGCQGYTHLAKDQLVSNYQKVLDEAMGDVLKENKIPVVFGSFSGVYGADFEPQQTAVLDFLIQFASTFLRGGYYWSLNPDTELYLEDSVTKGQPGVFGRTHFGMMQPTSWQIAHTELLTALSKMPSSPIPCYGEQVKLVKGKNGITRDGLSSVLGLTVVLVLSFWM